MTRTVANQSLKERPYTVGMATPTSGGVRREGKKLWILAKETGRAAQAA